MVAPRYGLRARAGAGGEQQGGQARTEYCKDFFHSGGMLIMTCAFLAFAQRCLFGVCFGKARGRDPIRVRMRNPASCWRAFKPKTGQAWPCQA